MKAHPLAPAVATAHQITTQIPDLFAQRSALHLLRWFALMGLPHPDGTAQQQREWMRHLRLAAEEATLCVNAASRHYIDAFAIQNALPAVERRRALLQLIALNSDGLYGAGTSTVVIETFSRQMAPFAPIVTDGIASGDLEQRCLRAQPLPHLQWLLEQLDAPAETVELMQAILDYPSPPIKKGSR